METKTKGDRYRSLKMALLGTGMFLLAASAVKAELAPTARYARGEKVDFALIIQEWKQKYPDVPVFVCVCSQPVCDSSKAWPFRRFARYQMNVALGPFNAKNLNEGIGFKCYDIETGSRPK